MLTLSWPCPASQTTVDDKNIKRMRIEHRYTKPRLPMPTDDDRITMLAEQIAVCRKELADLIASREVRIAPLTSPAAIGTPATVRHGDPPHPLDLSWAPPTPRPRPRRHILLPHLSWRP